MMHSHITLEVSHLSKAYDSVRLLSDVSFCVHSGEMLSIVGQNSSFKTTLAKILCGLEPYDSGTVLIGGEPANLASPTGAHRLGVVVLGEIARLCEDLTIAENIFLFGKQSVSPEKINRSWNSKKAVAESARSFLTKYGFGWLDPCDTVETLGLAEKQILAFLCALTQNARVMIIDDAFSALNTEELDQIFRVLEQIKAEGMSILYLSSCAKVPELADSLLLIQEGKIVFTAAGEALHRTDLTAVLCNDPPPRAYPKLPVKPGEEVFRCEHMSYRDLLTDISFGLHEGEILGIVGGAGVGKTTLARLLSGHLPKSGGTLYINKKPVRISSVHDAYQNGLRLILDDREFGIIQHLSLAENLIFPYYSSRKSVLSLISSRKYTETSYCLANRLDIDYFDIKQPPGLLSAGNQQKLVLSRGIVAGANIFILDEPTRGVDNIGRVQIYNMFNNLLREGKSIVILTSDLGEADGMCDRVLLLKDGTLSEISAKPATKKRNAV